MGNFSAAQRYSPSPPRFIGLLATPRSNCIARDPQSILLPGTSIEKKSIRAFFRTGCSPRHESPFSFGILFFAPFAEERVRIKPTRAAVRTNREEGGREHLEGLVPGNQLCRKMTGTHDFTRRDAHLPPRARSRNSPLHGTSRTPISKFAVRTN